MRDKLTALAAGIAAFRQYDATIPSQTIATFLTIALAGERGASVKEVMTQAGFEERATADRNTRYLCRGYVRRGVLVPGLDLVRSIENPDNTKENLWVLTWKGQQLAKHLTEAVTL